METDVASARAVNGPFVDSVSFLNPQLPSDNQRQQAEQQRKPGRKRKNPASASTAIVLKSILRHRSDLTPGGLCPKPRKKRTVTFSSTSEDKSSEARRWNNSRLRYLSLDLDRWDDLPLLPHTALRSLNRQKTRQTKRLKRSSSVDILRAALKAPALEAEDHETLDLVHKPGHRGHRDTEHRSSLMPETVPNLEYTEKSNYVNRWLHESSWSGTHPWFQEHQEVVPPPSLAPATHHGHHFHEDSPSVPPKGAPSLFSLSVNFHGLSLAPRPSSCSRQD